jgi:acetyltransferase-like isoleucine patch superfamily enzyme
MILELLRYLVFKIQEIRENYKYDSSTIAEKFRKQGAKVGKNCFIQINKLASEPYLVEIGNSVSIAPGVTLMTHDGASVIFRDEFPTLRDFGKIIIEDNCFIGARSIITAGVKIGKGSVVGPMSVVLRDVKPGSMVIGNPAIQVSTVEKYKEQCLREWRNQGLDKFNDLFDGMRTEISVCSPDEITLRTYNSSQKTTVDVVLSKDKTIDNY